MYFLPFDNFDVVFLICFVCLVIYLVIYFVSKIAL